ncbi:uncharacterized protein FIBRA_06867 [Fibroporia radiculosa]|uniref:Mediator of RNA polymerase II transcription subunit 25 von Willebrand factor type A domain-containing protein n=1 Tax=Fibroporia radiculosa TaxID=599839 RepID=J4IBH7_9APHY|nr:uncharacterized protein FIBRA_06867 [Fibroporia radiculosa]CCM04681.1 predicted protein [Fibroporia radiculosa]
MSDVIAIAYVVDSSLALADEWNQVIQEYIGPLLRRLSDLYGSRAHFRFGCVSYGSAETRPTPLIGKVFFNNAQTVLNDMRNDPSKVGIGRTGSGESGGLAALEGLVAAIELFESLRETMEVFASYVIHVAAAEPDSTERPQWNVMPTLDDVSWDTLSSEFQKREICYSAILLRQLPRYPELATSAAAGTIQGPWFPVRSSHSIHLSGFSSPKSKGTKRPSEIVSIAPEGSPVAKRSRVQSQPKHTSPKIADSTIQPTSATSTAAQSSSSTPTQVLGGFPISQFEERTRALQALMIQRQQQIKAHQVAGREDEARQANADYQKLATMHKQIAAAIHKHKASLASSVNAAGQSRSRPVSSNTQGGSSVASSNANDKNGVQTSASAPQPSQSVSSLDDVPMPDPPSPLGQPASNAHPPHLLQATSNHQNSLPDVTGPTHPAMESQMNRATNLPMQNSGQASQNPTLPAANPTQQVVNSAFGQIVWEGGLSWGPGIDLNGRVVQAHVLMHTQQPGHGTILRSMNWPSNVMLVAAPERVIPLFLLQDWLKRLSNQCAIVYFTPQVLQGNHKTNDENLRGLYTALQEKSIYAIATFTGPAGLPEKRMMLFPSKPGVFIGAFFLSMRGMPPMPKSEVCGFELTQLPPPVAMLLTKLSPQQQQTLNNLPLDKRLSALQQIMAARQQQLLNQAQQAQMPSQMPSQTPTTSQAQLQALQQKHNVFIMNPFVNGQPPPLGQAMSLTQNVSQQPQIPDLLPGSNPGAMLSQGASGMMHQRTSSAGSANGMGGVPNEVMQSFTQRKEGGGTRGMGM